MPQLLIIGARTLIGRRLPEVMTGDWEATYTSRQPVAGQSLILDLDAPDGFQPQARFDAALICAPVWLVSAALIARLAALGVTRLIAFSSTSRLTKASSAEPAERDVVAKLARGEDVVMTACAAHGIAWTILRPTLIYDEGRDENITRIHNFIVKTGFFPVCGPASGLRQPVHARDLAKAALQALGANSARNKAYNLSGGEDLSYAGMVVRLFDVLGRRPAILPVPEWGWRLGFAIAGFGNRQALKQNMQMALRMNHDLHFDHSDATRDFGYRPGPFRPDFTGEEKI